jgi:hypothetical protein
MDGYMEYQQSGIVLIRATDTGFIRDDFDDDENNDC